ncbi:MAG: ammonia-forming cytochrome c nitrite reductase subunit c552 [Verrucomicrobiales bacterium]|nr:ammonia-forming cytochrome c nitrite reductase subunit c552 [Verrucomicrobiales bacterium]
MARESNLHRRYSRIPIRWVFVALVLSTLLGGDRARAAESASPYVDWLKQQLPRPRPDAGYVGSEQCQGCHREEHSSWHRSYHRTMTQPATEATVIGRFDGSTVDCGGLAYRLGKEGERFWAEMPDPDVMMYVLQGGRKIPLEKIPRVRRPVVMTTGSHHYQTYWVTSKRYPGLLQTLPVVFLKEEQRWIPRDDAFMRGPDDTEHIVTQWNHHCIRCHSTGGNPGLDDQGQLKSAVGELGIACEACHGPGKAHVDQRRAAAAALPSPEPEKKKAEARASEPDPTIINPARLDSRHSTEICGQCHGSYVMRDEYAMEFARNGPLYRPGEELTKTRHYMTHPGAGGGGVASEDLRRNPEFYASRWWDDGTVLAGGREYTALLATPCYTKGTMSCLSCHSMHDSDPNDQLKPGKDGPGACTSCHREARFTTELRQHTGHGADSPGSNCLNCHMPYVTYALFKAIRTHQITSPHIASSARFGVPNACNLCHLDRTLEWTQTQLVRQYGQKEVPLDSEQKDTAAAVLWLLKGNAAQRVIAAWAMGWPPAQQASGTQWMAPLLSRTLADDYGPVRFVAARSLRTLPGYTGLAYDFLGSPSQRKDASVAALGIWRGGGFPPAGKPEVLIRSDGGSDTNRVAALLQSQDRRSVTIME